MTCFVYFLTVTVVTYYQRENPINKMTLLPYYTILVQTFILFLYYSTTERIYFERNKNKWFDMLSTVVFFLWLIVIMLNNLLYHLVSNLMSFQDRTPLSQVLIERDKHFNRERCIIKLYVAFFVFIAFLELINMAYLTYCIAVGNDENTYQEASTYKKVSVFKDLALLIIMLIWVSFLVKETSLICVEYLGTLF